ncbi:hypothetical protein PIIN_06284 [Serendipita indica DSM 11827]|uniref:Uncharacterized protein n=1 Tax=Serendipita indica (strain DSM 11827) TaxID=1109443 RepID=G4TM06_SERID|nr:hypothetical protein PIIN_06284 [Serendipita indica DSM 11827]
MSKQIHLDNKRSPVVDEYHFSRLNDALEPYARAVQSCWSSCRCVRLYCTVPTCPSSNADLHDLKDLQSRCFGFIHALVKLLRTSGVYASYHLTFAPTSQVVVRALDAQHTCGQDHHCEDEKVALERASACDPHTATVLVLHDTPVLVAS